jgi:hypothetical protein
MKDAPRAPATRKLDDARREWIVRRLAAYDSPGAIRRDLKERFGIEISRNAIAQHDPSREPKRAKRWTVPFCTARRDHDASRADLTAAARQVAQLALRIVQLLERRILAGPGRAARGCAKSGPITDADRMRALTGFVARLRVTDPAGIAAIRRALSERTAPRRRVPHAG